MSDLTGADLCGIERDYPTSTPAGRTIAALVAALRQARAERDTLQKQLERAQGAEADLATMLIRTERAEAERDALAAAWGKCVAVLQRVPEDVETENCPWCWRDTRCEAGRGGHAETCERNAALAIDPLCAAALAHERNREAVIRAAARLVTSWHPDSMGHDTLDAEDGLRAAVARLREENPQ